MVMHCNEGVDPNGETDAGTNEEEHISINKRISLTEETSALLPVVQGSKPHGGEILCTHPDRPCDPLSLLYQG
jgi:hypothetical protein